MGSPAQTHGNHRSRFFRNVIMFLGDGMGDSEITIARNYAVGAAGRLTMDSLPADRRVHHVRGAEGHVDVPDYVTDSAASGTGWATGHKTYNNAVSVDPVTLAPLPTMLENAQAAGYKTGNVTTAELTDATPAVLDRPRHRPRLPGPADMAHVPDEDQAGRRAGLDRRADRRPQRRRAAGRRQGRASTRR